MSPSWPDSRWTIARRDLSSLSREKTIVLALVIQLFIAGFSSFLVVGLTSLYDPDATEGGEIAVAMSGEAAEELEALAEETDDVALRSQGSEEEALALFEAGVADAVLITDRRATANGSILDVNAIVPAEDLRTTVIVVSLRDFLADFETLERSDRVEFLEFEPIEVPEEESSSPYFGFTYTILLPLLLFLPPFISGSVAVDSLTEEIERGTLELLRVAPVSLVDIVDGKAAGMIAIAPAQALLWIILLRFNGIAIDYMTLLLLFVTAITVLTVAIGLVLALLMRRRQQAQLLYSMIVLGLFGLAVVLPEHPASTVAKLAVDSTTSLTFAMVTATTVVAVGAVLATRAYVARINPESL